jgi:hypothetical protein
MTRNLTALGLAVIAGAALQAQESTGTIVGTVKTKKGQPVAGATVILTSVSLQGARQMKTDASGAFRAPLLPPGTYQIAVAKEGFVAPKATVDVPLGQVVRQDLLMAPAAAAAEVEVVATNGGVDKADVKTSTNITSGQLDQIPRSTRGLDTVALLTPGVTLGVGSRVQIRGGQTTQNRFLLNGTDIADNVFGNTNGRNFYVDDSIQETQVIQSPVHARYGNFTGGVINAISKSGSNEFSAIFRANISRPSWSAVPPLGMRKGGIPSNAGTQNTEDWIGREYSLWVGGPIIKDRLWFAASTKLNPTSVTPQNFSNVAGLTTGDGTGAPAFGTGTGQSGQPFSLIQDTTFYELKLTFAVTPNHSLELAGNTNKVDQEGRFYVASFDPDTLVPQKNENNYITLGYRGLIGSNLSLEARWAKKHQLLQAGGDPAKGDPIRARYSNGTYYIFQNGIFNRADGGDNRDIQTWTANATWYSPDTAVGTFTLDAGFEFLYQDRQAANDQSPTQRQYFVWGRNADGTYRVAGAITSPLAQSLNFVNLYSTDRGKAKTDTLGYYLNGLWAINSHWQVMLGARYDKVTAKDTLGAETVSSSRFSPRLQLTYDLFGDQAWVGRASFARYVGKLNDSFTNRFTRAGNPITERYGWAGAADNAASYATVTTLTNWDVTQTGLTGYSGPLNRFVDSSVKAPYNDEYSAGIRHNLGGGSFVNFTYTQRKGGGFFNDIFTIGDQVTVPLVYVNGGSREVIAERWITDDRLKRDYKSAEFEFLFKLSRVWTFGGNYTYAILKGNGEGSEGNNPPVSGDVIGDYESVHASRGRDMSYYAPYGYLTGDQKHRARMYLSWNQELGKASAFYGSLLFNYNGGGTYSLTRDLSFEAQTDATGAGSTIASSYPTSYTRYYGPRGLGRFNDTFGFDLKLGAEVPVVAKLKFFTEVTITNVFNHWQVATYSTASTSGTSLATTSPLAGYRANALTGVPNNTAGYGTYDFNSYVGGRTVTLSAGFKW